VQIVIENPLLRRKYPSDGSINAVMDTGYQGFLSVPESIFKHLHLHRLVTDKRRISLANGAFSNTRGCYASVQIPHLSMKIDGFVETFAGLDEILLGTEALLETKIVLDYCAKRVKLEKCTTK